MGAEFWFYQVKKVLEMEMVLDAQQCKCPECLWALHWKDGICYITSIYCHDIKKKLKQKSYHILYASVLFPQSPFCPDWKGLCFIFCLTKLHMLAFLPLAVFCAGFYLRIGKPSLPLNINSILLCISHIHLPSKL
jgi:hypothetical protein